ncbi:hypothetical protein OAF56_03415, partial [Pirellulaceae bacterium]|nr:hypothetical protein [Pirellulaceae bacterium]
MTLKNFLNSPNLTFVFLVTASTLVLADDTPDFNREIFPILSENCLACHGPDENVREAGLRLDQKDGAFAELDSGSKAIVAGKSSESELYLRMTSDDEDLLMPPPDSGKKVSEEDKAKIKTWIDSGAKWSKHWAFVPPVKSEVPQPVGGW